MEAYIYQAELICGFCATEIMKSILPPDGFIFGNDSSFDSDNYPKGPFSDGGGEADTAQFCGVCAAALNNPIIMDLLTDNEFDEMEL